MKWLESLKSVFAGKSVQPAAPEIKTAEFKRQSLTVSDDAVAQALSPAVTPSAFYDTEGAFFFPPPLPGVVPKGVPTMAADANLQAAYNFIGNGVAFSEGIQAFPFAYLSELTQRSEYRRPSEILAKEMTRKWIRLQAAGEEDKTAKIADIEAEMKRLGVQSIFRKAIEMDGFFGRAHIYMDFGYDNTSKELQFPLVLSPAKIRPNSLRRLLVIEPIWTYPNEYNSNNPLNETFYKPQSWFVMGDIVHATRLLTIIGRPVPDILKPSYSFGGLSLSQMLKPYVDNWLRTRQSVANLVSSFSKDGIKTNMGADLNSKAMQNLQKRAQIYTAHKDNRGLMILDKDSEEFFNVSTPLSSLDALQAQSQEQMSSPCGIPLSILLGITPSGLNASTDGEVRTFYQLAEAQQQSSIAPALKYLIDVIQISLFGAVDPDITFMFIPLWSMSDKELAEIEKIQSETDVNYVGAGILDPIESRQRLANDPDSPYHGIDADDVPEPPDEDGDDDFDPTKDEKDDVAKKDTKVPKEKPAKSLEDDEGKQNT